MANWDFSFWIWEHARLFVSSSGTASRGELERSRGQRSVTWHPPVDVFETDEAYWLIVALPGVDPAQVTLELGGRKIIISGTRSVASFCQKATVHRLEIPNGSFAREIELPPGEIELGERRFMNGCLVLELRKRK